MKKTHIRNYIYRYWVCWKSRKSRRRNGLCELLRVKRPGSDDGGSSYGGEVWVENLETGEVIQNTMTFRTLGEMKNLLAKDRFGKRLGALRALEITKHADVRNAEKRQARRSPKTKLERALDLEKAWVRKAKLAATKLKKLRVKIKRLRQTLASSPEPETSESSMESQYPRSGR